VSSWKPVHETVFPESRLVIFFEWCAFKTQFNVYFFPPILQVRYSLSCYKYTLFCMEHLDVLLHLRVLANM